MLKKLVWLFEDFGWNIRCRYNYWLHGPYGLCKVIERIPFRFIIKYLRKYGAKIEDNCTFERGLRLHRPLGSKPFENLSIGKNVYLGHNVLLDLTQQVVIKDFVCIGADTQIWTHSGYYDIDDENKYVENVGKVVVEDHVIIYSDAIISQGVTIEKFSRVGANSLVNRNVGRNCFVAGIPAKIIDTQP